jgi:hypothetical protein
MQAIQTKFLGPTNHRGSRIKATCEAGSITVPWDHGADIDANHGYVAMMLAQKLGWTGDEYGELKSGCLPNNAGYAHVFVRR